VRIIENICSNTSTLYHTSRELSRGLNALDLKPAKNPCILGSTGNGLVTWLGEELEDCGWFQQGGASAARWGCVRGTPRL
jgi:hypothetical protein